MDSMRQVGAGILLGIISIVMILGGFSLAMVEAGVTPANQPSSPTANTTLSIIITVFPTLTPIMTLTSEETATTIAVSPTGGFTTTSTSILPTALLTTVTQAATLTICPAPAGWLPIVVQPYETLAGLSRAYRTSVELLRTKNCLLSDQLVAGSILYVPALPSSTPLPCGAPANWGYYTVVPGDTLYHISQLYRVSVQQLMQANCLRSSTINAGTRLRVPNVSTSTPAGTETPLPTVTDMPSEAPSETSAPTQTQSATPPPPSVTATSAATVTATSPATVTPTPPTS